MRKELERVRDQLSESNVRVAVLKERVQTSNRQKHLRNTAIAGGSAILGLAIQLDQLGAIPYVLGAVGFVFVLMGWFWSSTENDH